MVLDRKEGAPWEEQGAEDPPDLRRSINVRGQWYRTNTSIAQPKDRSARLPPSALDDQVTRARYHSADAKYLTVPRRHSIAGRYHAASGAETAVDWLGWTLVRTAAVRWMSSPGGDGLAQ